MRIALFVNPHSGRKHGERIAQHAAERLADAGHDVQTIQGSDAVAARSALGHALTAGLDAVVVVGGDGALHGIMSDVVEAGVTVGLLPAGTGNDTARALDLPLKNPDAAIDIVMREHTRCIDLARVDDDQYVATVVASGFDSKVNERANQMRWPRGNLRYNIAMVAELRAFQPLDFTLTLGGGGVLQRKAMLVAVGNGPSFGGGMRICEGASIDDGLLDVVVINPVSKAKLIRVFPQLYQGTHTTLPEFERHRVRSVTLESAGIVAYGDGERIGPLPATITVQPRAVAFFAP